MVWRLHCITHVLVRVAVGVAGYSYERKDSRGQELPPQSDDEVSGPIEDEDDDCDIYGPCEFNLAGNAVKAPRGADEASAALREHCKSLREAPGVKLLSHSRDYSTVKFYTMLQCNVIQYVIESRGRYCTHPHARQSSPGVREGGLHAKKRLTQKIPSGAPRWRDGAARHATAAKQSIQNIPVPRQCLARWPP